MREQQRMALFGQPLAHRGLHDGNKVVWENTLTGFRLAAEAGYGIELDVQLSADGVALVFHDENLARLTGRPGFIHELTAAQACQVHVGGTADHIAPLAQVLAFVAGRVPVIIELKGNPGHDDGLVRAVAADLSGYSGPAAVMSFAHWHVRKLADQAPGLARGLTAEGVEPGQQESHFSMLAHDIQFISFSVNELPNRFVQTVRDKLAMPVITWTVRTPEHVALTLAHGDQMTFEGFRPPCSAGNIA